MLIPIFLTLDNAHAVGDRLIDGSRHEVAECSWRRLERHLAEARVRPGKTLDAFDFEAVPVIRKAQVMALAAGDVVITPAVDRLSRDTTDLLVIARDMQRARASIRSLAEP